MNCFLKVAYLHKHKKYRYHKDKPINFNQIRQQLGIHHPSTAIRYQLDSPNSVGLSQTISERHVFNEEALVQYLRDAIFEANRTIKISIKISNHSENMEKDSQSYSQHEDVCLPITIEKMRSKSEEIDLGKTVVEVTENLDITQEFIYNSQLEWFRVQKSQEMLMVQRQLAMNSKRLKLLGQKRKCCDLQKLMQYWEKMRKEVC